MPLQAQAAQEQQQTSAKQLAELQWELQHAWQQSKQAAEAQKAALQVAQDKIVKLEADGRQNSQQASRVQESAARAKAEAGKLAQELVESKVSKFYCLQTSNKLGSTIY